MSRRSPLRAKKYTAASKRSSGFYEYCAEAANSRNHGAPHSPNNSGSRGSAALTQMTSQGGTGAIEAEWASPFALSGKLQGGVDMQCVVCVKRTTSCQRRNYMVQNVTFGVSSCRSRQELMAPSLGHANCHTKKCRRRPTNSLNPSWGRKLVGGPKCQFFCGLFETCKELSRYRGIKKCVPCFGHLIDSTGLSFWSRKDAGKEA